METMIGKLTYPESVCDAEIFKSVLYTQDNGNKLAFSIINRSNVAVTAFHVDVIYFDKETEKKISVEQRDCYIEPNAVCEEITVTLPNGVEEGRIALPVVLYDNLTASQSYVNVPFASFDVVSKFAIDYLSGNVAPVKTTYQAQQSPVAPVAKTAPAKVDVASVKTVKQQPVNNETGNVPVTEVKDKKKTTKQVLSIVFMCVALFIAFISVFWVTGFNRKVVNLVGDYYNSGNVTLFIFVMLTGITLAFVSTLERKGFDKGRWAITLANSLSGSWCFMMMATMFALYGSPITLFLIFVFPIAPAVITNVISKKAVSSVLLIIAFCLSWFCLGTLVGAVGLGPTLVFFIEAVVLFVTGLLVRCNKGKRMISAKVFAILAAVTVAIFILTLNTGMVNWEYGLDVFVEVIAVGLAYIIPFVVGLIVALVRKDRFAWITLLCLLVVVLISILLPIGIYCL